MRYFDKIYTNKNLFWAVLAALALLLRVVFGYWPAACEYLYSRGLFFGVRLGVDYTLGWLPFATVYLLFGYFCYQIVIKVSFVIQTYPKLKVWGLLQLFLLFLSRLLSKTVFFFLFLWGFNYARIPIETQFNLVAAPLDINQLRQEAIWAQRQAIATRILISNADEKALNDSHFNMDMETELRGALAAVLEAKNIPAFGRPRLRRLRPDGLLLGFSASGVYIPFTAEAHVENALHCSQIPFTIAHELAHAYGWGDEAVCNFLGLLACLRTDAPVLRYAGYLAYWRYAMGELKRLDNDFYKELRAQIPAGMAADLSETYAALNKYPSFFSTFQKTAYDAYLKSQGVKEGVQSYDRVVLLVAAWRNE